METKTPAANGRGVEMLPGDFRSPFNVTRHRAQAIAVRFALPLETAAIVADIAFGGGGQ